MSTSATIHFQQPGDDQPTAIVYYHYDGTPAVMEKLLENFFQTCRDQGAHDRFRDPAYLAARAVVYFAGLHTDDPAKPLRFLSVGVVTEDPPDVSYRYVVLCTLAPQVQVQKRQPPFEAGTTFTLN